MSTQCFRFTIACFSMPRQPLWAWPTRPIIVPRYCNEIVSSRLKNPITPKFCPGSFSPQNSLCSEQKWEGTMIDQSWCFSPVTIFAAHSLAVFRLSQRAQTKGWFPFLHRNWSTVYPIWKFVLWLDRGPSKLASDQNLGLWTEMGRNCDRSKFMFLSWYSICSPFPWGILTLAAGSEPGACSLSCIMI